MEHLTKASVSEIADFFIKRKTAEVSERSRLNWHQRLRRFKQQIGDRRLAELSPMHLDAFRSTLAGAKPTYANTILSHVRCFLGWTWEVGLIEKPFRTAEVLKDFRRKPIEFKGKDPEVVRTVIAKVHEYYPSLALAMLLQYRGCLRPSEVGRLGEAINRNPKVQKTYEIYSKTSNKVGTPRTVLISDDLIVLLERLKKQGVAVFCGSENAYRLALKKAGMAIRDGYRVGFYRGDSYSSPVAKGAEIRKPDPEFLPRYGWKTLTAHWLRHSSATHCVNLDLPESHVRLILGRARPSVDRHYIPREAWEPARKSIGRLSELVPVSLVDDK
jgi:integrase